MKKAIQGVTDVATTHPHLITECSTPEKLRDLLPGSNTLVWWEHGNYNPRHTWQTSVKNRTRGSGCPYCSTPAKAVLSGFNSLADVAPHLVKEYSDSNEKKPDQISANHAKKVKWQCANSHIWEATPHQRVQKNSGCPFCAGSVVEWGGDQCLATLRPALVEEWHPDNEGTPEQYSVSARYKAKWKCKSCSNEWFSAIYHRSAGQGCGKCATSGTSKLETEIQDYVKSLGVSVTINDRTVISPKEIDIYIPEKRLGIEFNGLYWHTEDKKHKQYHQKKYMLAKENNIVLLQVWEDDWLYRKSIVQRMIKHKLGLLSDEKIYARNTEVRDITYQESRDFLNKTHIQGSAKGTKYAGLYCKKTNMLVAVAVIKVATKFGQNAYYLERYATSITLPGGLSKLLKYFERTIGVYKWVTYADCSVSSGSVYINLGFVEDKILPADYSYVRPGNRHREHKFNYRIKRFKRDVELSYIEGTTESELAKINGMSRVWDAGKLRYVKEVKN